MTLGIVSGSGRIQRAALTWTTRNLNAANVYVDSLVYGNGIYITNGGARRRSTDGITWTTITVDQNQQRSIAYGNGIFIMGVDDGQGIRRSTDGITWTVQNAFMTIPSQQQGNLNIAPMTVGYGNGVFLVAGTYSGSTILRTSTDAITWTTRTAPSGRTPSSYAYGNGIHVIGSNSFANPITSTDAITWVSASNSLQSVRNISYGNGLFVGISSSSILYSTNGTAWTPAAQFPGAVAGSQSVFGNGVWVAVGYNGTIMFSTNAVTWTSRTSNFGTTRIHAIAYGNSLFVAGGESGIRTSSF